MNIKIFLILFTIGFSFLDYQDKYQLYCKQQNISSTELWKKNILHQIDRFSFIILCPILILANIFIIITFIKYKDTRNQPGDLIMGISISQIFLLGNWLIYSIYVSINNPKYLANKPQNFQNFCKGVGFFAIAGATLQFTYNCLFSIYIIYVIKTTLKEGNIPKITLHIIAILIVLAIILYNQIKNNIGISIFGTCSFKINNLFFSYLLFSLVILYLIISLSAMIYLSKKIPQSQNFQRIRKVFLNYYFHYIIASVTIWCILAISNIILINNCFKNSPNSIYQIFSTIGNLAKLCTSIFLTILRYNNPSIRLRLKYLLRKICLSWNRNYKNYNQLTQAIIKKQQKWFQQLKHNLKISQLFSFLACIHKNIITQKITFILNKIDIYNYIGLSIQQLQLGYSIFYFQAIDFFYFRQIRSSQTYQIIQSLSFEVNKQKLKKMQKQGQGGKSGQFFYFTGDKKYLIKTITQQQGNVFKLRLNQFIKYFQNNKNTLIVKIEGYFKFIDNQTRIKNTFHVILMKNILNTQKENIINVYDLKGSTFNREVLKNKNNQSQKTMKDVDFLRLQKKIYLSQQNRIKLKEQIFKDSQFLQQLQLIDYSLILFKGKFKSEYQSINQSDIYYQFGIIDYFQLYDIKKFTEKQTKKLIKLDPYLDTSSQNPKKYGIRFRQFINNIL